MLAIVRRTLPSPPEPAQNLRKVVKGPSFRTGQEKPQVRLPEASKFCFWQVKWKFGGPVGK